MAKKGKMYPPRSERVFQSASEGAACFVYTSEIEIDDTSLSPEVGTGATVGFSKDAVHGKSAPESVADYTFAPLTDDTKINLGFLELPGGKSKCCYTATRQDG
jgi:hypothetical protein